VSDQFITRLEGEQELLRQLRAVQHKLDYARPMYERIGAVMERNINLRFETKKDPAGVNWTPWKPRTVHQYSLASKGRKQGSLLERTRRMRNSLAYNASNTNTEIGFSVPYAQYHETGTSKMVRRGLLVADIQHGELGQADRSDILQVVSQYLNPA
jgi:phage virion morphogenesis protein